MTQKAGEPGNLGTNKGRLLAALRSERARLEALLSTIAVDRMDVAGVSGFYSTKDILAHLNAYNRALVTWLQEARAGRAYVDPVLDQPDLEARNAAVYEANRDRPVADVVEAFRQTWDGLEALALSLTEEELTDAEVTAWFVVPRWHRRQALWQCIANDSYEHLQQHLPDIERWLAEQGRKGDSF